MIEYRDSDRLEFEEYVDFLKRTDLGSQYPKQNFESRVRRVLKNVDICITARRADGLLVGICFGLTDFAYFLFLTDLGVDRAYVKQGIGRKLLQMVVEKAGGPDDITVSTISNNKALGFYAACGMKNEVDLVVRYCQEWESFVVA
ncbi:MAG: GNAT family N-acetyltransferase [Chlorobia bacterium]|nr:GNAT family N-acetyltransferase [Fimbriimonadaceae bacterium]